MTAAAVAPDRGQIHWRWYPWAELSVDQLYEILRLRSAIFVVEQNCVFHEMDGMDRHCEHLCGHDRQGQLVAYARLVPPGRKFAEPSIGRVVSAHAVRGTGVGRALMHEAIAGCMRRYGTLPIKLSAQQHLERFYGEFGFQRSGEPYLEDGIAHIDMCRAGDPD